MRVVCDADIMPTTKAWSSFQIAIDCPLAIWAARVLGGRDVVRVGEGEDEAFYMVLVAAGVVPWKRSVATKEMTID